MNEEVEERTTVDLALGPSFNFLSLILQDGGEGHGRRMVNLETAERREESQKEERQKSMSNGVLEKKRERASVQRVNCLR